MTRFILSVFVITFAVACAGPLKNQPVCPESKSVSCLTGLDCEYDEKRGCDVCRCQEPAYVPFDR